MSSVDLSPEERAKIVAARADVKYGPFASLHEAYGVLVEEVYESDCALSSLSEELKTNARCQLMPALHGDKVAEFVSEAEHGRAHTLLVIERLKQCIAEHIDVIAVCDRIIAQWGEKS
jgi:hypothetical protein